MGNLMPLLQGTVGGCGGETLNLDRLATELRTGSELELGLCKFCACSAVMYTIPFSMF